MTMVQIKKQTKKKQVEDAMYLVSKLRSESKKVENIHIQQKPIHDYKRQLNMANSYHIALVDI